MKHALILSALACGAFMACTAPVDKKSTTDNAASLVGAFTQGDTLSAADLAVFTSAVKGIDFLADWNPVRVSRQVVAGTNYRFYCQTGPDKTGTLQVFVPLAGRQQITGINGEHNAALVIVNRKTGKVMGIYEGETPKEYVGMLQDNFRVARSKARLELRSAAIGEGFVWLREFGSIAVKRNPAGYGEPLGTISHIEGELPEVLPCTGQEDGCYRVVFNQMYGYVEADKMMWAPINTF